MTPFYQSMPHLLGTPGRGDPLEFVDGELVSHETGEKFPIENSIPQFLVADFDQSVAEHYETRGSSASSSFDTVGYHFQFHYSQVHKSIRKILSDLPHGSKLADIGCGHGALTAPFTEQFTVFGIDLAQSMLEHAGKLGLHPMRGSATALPFTNSALDCCLAAEMLQHLSDIEPFFEELARVTKPDGTVLVSTINRASIARRTNRYLRGMNHTEQARLRTIDDVRNAIAGQPLHLERIVWIMSPLPFGVSTRSGNDVIAPFAQNFVVVLKRA